MQILVHQLSSYLSDNDLALVLRCTDAQKTPLDSHVFHSSPQLFLLMAEPLQKQNNDNPVKPQRSTAVMYRYFSKAEWVLDTHELHDLSYLENEEEQSVTYSDYVRNSLELVDRSELNPFLLHPSLKEDDGSPSSYGIEESNDICTKDDNYMKPSKDKNIGLSPDPEHQCFDFDYGAND